MVNAADIIQQIEALPPQEVLRVRDWFDSRHDASDAAPSGVDEAVIAEVLADEAVACVEAFQQGRLETFSVEEAFGFSV
jgi:putative NIF3 family GTP cyclohydrolase 1 type 2